jgi:hypothetical protein
MSRERPAALGSIMSTQCPTPRPALNPAALPCPATRVAAITRVETRITAGRGIAREECTGNSAQYQLPVFNFAPTWDQFYDAPRLRSKNPALARHPGNASHSARRPALRRTKAVIRGAFRGASCIQGSASITAMSPSPSLSK